MSNSRRARRYDARQRRGKRTVALNLVSLMDIFTILVFFLLVSQAESDTLPKDDKLKLPDSIAQSKPKQTVNILITTERVMVQNRPVAALADVQKKDAQTITAVKQALQKELDRIIDKGAKNKAKKREVTILADKSIPFSTLKKVMNTCTSMGYNKISLAVNQTSADAAGE